MAEERFQSGSHPLIDVEGLRTYFPVLGGVFRHRIGWIKAVDGVSISIRRGETLGLVGESGCGKSTLGRSIIRLTTPTAGSVRFDGRDLLSVPRRAMKRLRRHLQIIFQDPYGSLDPGMTVEDIVGEGLKAHGMHDRKGRQAVVKEMLEAVGLGMGHAGRYPHEFSGGQRQRIGIARALALRPAFVVADEPVSALDVSIQAQILNLMKDLQERYGLTYLFIAHDLSVVEYVSDRVAVMYLGKLVELGVSDDLYADPRMPYTQALLSAVPSHDPSVRPHRIVLHGDVPSPLEPPSGCPFRTRCWLAQEVCAALEPALREVAPGHWVACHFA